MSERLVNDRLYISLPATWLPPTVLDNEAVVARVRGLYRGGPEEWAKIERSIRFVFTTCGARIRHVQEEAPHAAGTYGAEVARRLLEEQGLTPADLDVLVYAAITREYFEPAVATELAWRLGAKRALGFDVVAACASPLLAIDTLRGRAFTDPDWQVALVSTASLSSGFISYDIQEAAQLDQLAAGLTVGQASTAFLVGRRPFPRCGRIVGSYLEGASEHHPLCRAPVFGVFHSDGAAIFALAELVPDHVQRACRRFGWKVEEIDLFLLHQPSDRVLRGVADALGVPRSRVPRVHGLYGNTEASAVPLVLRHAADQGLLRPGMKLLLGSAAAGFTLASVAVEWQG